MHRFVYYEETNSQKTILKAPEDQLGPRDQCCKNITNGQNCPILYLDLCA